MPSPSLARRRPTNTLGIGRYETHSERMLSIAGVCLLVTLNSVVIERKGNVGKCFVSKP